MSYIMVFITAAMAVLYLMFHSARGLGSVGVKTDEGHLFLKAEFARWAINVREIVACAEYERPAPKARKRYNTLRGRLVSGSRDRCT